MDGYSSLDEESWRSAIVGTTMYKLSNKLQLVKSCTKMWLTGRAIFARWDCEY